jgi:hypothetical protein
MILCDSEIRAAMRSGQLVIDFQNQTSVAGRPIQEPSA